MRGRLTLSILVTLITLVAASLCTSASAENWPAWRGPRGDGTSLEKNVPTKWDGPSGENIAWRVAIPGGGHASPIVWEDRIFLTSCLDEKDQPARVLLCLHRETGERLWQRTVLTAPLETKHNLNSYASGTPSTDGRHVFVTFLEVGDKTIEARNVSRPRPVTPGELTPVDGSVVIHSAEEILTEHPVHTGRGWEDGVFVADVDADGAAEIVAPASRRAEGEGVRKGIVVLEHDGTGWKGAGPHWPQSPFRPGEILPDGTVTAPGVVELSLARGAMVNARPITEPTHELSLELAGSCAASCAGEVRAVVRVSNHGVAYLREGDAELVVRGTEPGAIVARAAVPPTDPGDISADVEVVVPRTADLPVANEVRIELRLPDGVVQCSPEEDAVTVTLPSECASLR